MFCPHCGNEVNQFGDNCNHCGRDLGAAQGSKKRTFWPWIKLAIALLILALFGSCIYGVSTAIKGINSPTGPFAEAQKTEFLVERLGDAIMAELRPQADAFMDALVQNDLDAAYELTHTKFKSSTDHSAFMNFLDHNGLNKITSYKITQLSYIPQDTPYLTAKIYNQEEEEATLYLDMATEDNTWHIIYMTLR